MPPAISAVPMADPGFGKNASSKYAIITLVVTLAAVLVWHGHLAGLTEDLLATALLIIAGILGIASPVLDIAQPGLPMAPLIALVGCDGSGKTTLSGDLRTSLAPDGPVSICYLGLGSGALGLRLKRMPLVGRLLERKLSKKAKQARTKGETIPGLPTAIVVYAFSLIRLRRFRRVVELRRSGVTVITDRYPQTEVVGFYDGPGLSAAKPGNRLVALLAKKEQRMYRWMASFRPDVVIRLNVELATAFARKPDHTYDLLQQKVEATALLRFAGARIIDVDSNCPYSDVRTRAETIVRQALRQERAVFS